MTTARARRPLPRGRIIEAVSTPGDRWVPDRVVFWLTDARGRRERIVHTEKGALRG